MSSSPLTVRDLLAEPEFRLEAQAGSRSFGRAVDGIHLSELDDPTPWMVPSSILLTTGLNIDTDHTAGVRLVETLSVAGMSGLGIALGHYLTTLPPTMVQRAEEISFPLFTLPMDVPFRRVSAYVYDALASRDTYRLRRSMAVQSHLLELLIEERGVEELVQQLAHLLETTVLLYDGRGSLLTVARGQARFSSRGMATLWERYLEHRGRREILPAFQSSGFRVSYREVSLHGVVERVLLAAYANRPIPELAETTLSFAQKLLTLDVLRNRDVADLQRRMRTGLMDDLVSGIGTETELSARMRQYDLAPEKPWRIAVLDVDSFTERFPAEGHPAQRETRMQEFKNTLLEAVDSFLAGQGLPFLTMLKSDSVVTLVQFTDTSVASAERTLVSLREAVEENLAPVTLSVGVSAAATGATGAATAFRQAREALGLTKPVEGLRTRFFDLVHPQSRLLDSQSPEGLAAIYEETIALLDDHDRERRTQLLRTLEVFLTQERSLNRTAETLHMHRNTLAKRIARIEEILGRSLAVTDDLVAIGLGLRARELLAGRRTLS
ncbi:MAG: PucR family transcriptional regulator ligand-binding domain-containing protein [Actinobacteria bacterium]|nr:PucR family transcriptional regulator ligand-binding domain-containing protein [Actinomycetota bacterium]